MGPKNRTTAVGTTWVQDFKKSKNIREQERRIGRPKIFRKKTNVYNVCFKQTSFVYN